MDVLGCGWGTDDGVKLRTTLLQPWSCFEVVGICFWSLEGWGSGGVDGDGDGEFDGEIDVGFDGEFEESEMRVLVAMFIELYVLVGSKAKSNNVNDVQQMKQALNIEVKCKYDSMMSAEITGSGKQFWANLFRDAPRTPHSRKRVVSSIPGF